MPYGVFLSELFFENSSMNTHSSKPGLMDTHVHLCDPAFADNLQEILQRTRDCGITAILAVVENWRNRDIMLRVEVCCEGES